MFLTASEVRYFKSTGLAAVEAAALSVNATVSYSLIAWRVSRPYLRQAWVFFLWTAAFTIAAGMIARELWEEYHPIAMAKIDAIVESGYGDWPQDEEQDQPVDKPAPAPLPVAAKTITQPTLTVKRGIRELRQEAKAQGIKGFARMTLAQLAEHGIVQ